jgi:serine/threonine-protein kinase
MSRYEPGQIVDRYELVEQLGEGAYAQVWRAKDTTSGTQVVMKFPMPELFGDPGLFQRYRRESEIAKRLQHPNIQRALDDGARRSEPYLVLEYVEGPNLRTWMREHEGPCPVQLVIEWGKQLAGALAYLHEAGIVHRDLKPENIVVSKSNQLKLTDFGTAMAKGVRRLTFKHLGQALGTPDYMSPEQIQGGRGDERSDIYSLGILLYELLCGRVPFQGDNWLAVMAAHLTQSPVSPRELRPETPDGLAEVICHAMRRFPEHRYAHASEMLYDLEHLEELPKGLYDLSPEEPMSTLAAAAMESGKRTLLLALAIAAAFLVLATTVIVLATLVH